MNDNVLDEPPHHETSVGGGEVDDTWEPDPQILLAEGREGGDADVEANDERHLQSANAIRSKTELRGDEGRDSKHEKKRVLQDVFSVPFTVKG